MTQRLPTRWKLASALIAAGLYDMAERAVLGLYDDYLSPYDLPITILAHELQRIGTPEALLIRRQAMAGEFDATAEEGALWAQSPEGQAMLAKMRKG